MKFSIPIVTAILIAIKITTAFSQAPAGLPERVVYAGQCEQPGQVFELPDEFDILIAKTQDDGFALKFFDKTWTCDGKGRGYRAYYCAGEGCEMTPDHFQQEGYIPVGPVQAGDCIQTQVIDLDTDNNDYIWMEYEGGEIITGSIITGSDYSGSNGFVIDYNVCLPKAGDVLFWAGDSVGIWNFIIESAPVPTPTSTATATSVNVTPTSTTTATPAPTQIQIPTSTLVLSSTPTTTNTPTDTPSPTSTSTNTATTTATNTPTSTSTSTPTLVPTSTPITDVATPSTSTCTINIIATSDSVNKLSDVCFTSPEMKNRTQFVGWIVPNGVSINQNFNADMHSMCITFVPADICNVEITDKRQTATASSIIGEPQVLYIPIAGYTNKIRQEQ